MIATTFLAVIGLSAMRAEKSDESFQSGKRGNLVVVINPSPSRQLPAKKMPGVVNPSLALALDEKGRIVSFDKPAVGEYSTKDLTNLVSSLFGDSDTAELIIVIKNPEVVSVATLAALIEKMSEVVDKKKVLTLYIQTVDK